MTLTELRYVVAVARERHFGRAAEACFVSQPTLSVGIKRLEGELGLQLFDRGPGEVTPTELGERIVQEAARVLEQVQGIRDLAREGLDPLDGPLRLGVIYTIAPYLLPGLVRSAHARAPRMPLLLEENYTARLREQLRNRELDAAILALPFEEPGYRVRPLYDEAFVAAVPRGHPLARSGRVSPADLRREPAVLLGSGHCFRDQVLQACPDLNRFSGLGEGIQRSFEGSSLETIRQMVASGVGLAVMPATAAAGRGEDSLVAYVPLAEPVPERRVGLVYRSNFSRRAALDLLCACVLDSGLAGARMLDLPAQ